METSDRLEKFGVSLSTWSVSTRGCKNAPTFARGRAAPDWRAGKMPKADADRAPLTFTTALSRHLNWQRKL